MQISYRPKFGILGRAIDAFVLRRQMRGLMARVLEGLAEKAALRSGT